MGLLGWLLGGSAEAGTDRLKAEALMQKIKSGQKMVLIDVRQPEELTSPLGALPGVKNIPLPDLGRRFAEIPKDRDVVLICRSGHRSGQALNFLKRQGYTRIQDVDGGMMAIRALPKK
ncbi:MAG: rhodanese-like domain-containing protein [Candidatus Firestonebacteria bacterium]|nr:rhodanese-like domain-containing protein [Candidatus Firestonebacteria bacterium]